MKKIVVIGYGGQGSWHCEQILKDKNLILGGVFDNDDNKIIKAKQNGIFSYDSITSILNDDSVDIIVIATPNNSHKDLVIKSLQSGKNVICEKPVEMTVSAFDEMCDVAKHSNKIFSVHQNRRWDIDFLAMKKIVKSKEIGDLLRIESRIHGSRGIPSDWRCKKEFGGGMILDWGVHLIDQILQIIDNKIIGIYCETTHITNKEVDDGFKLNIYFENDISAYIEVGTYNFIAMPRFYLQCSNGTAILNKWNDKTQVSKLKAWNEKDVLPVQTAAGITKTMAPRDEITLNNYTVEKEISDVHDYYKNFCDAVDGKAESIVRLSEVRRVLQVMECAFKSAQSKQRIETII